MLRTKLYHVMQPKRLRCTLAIDVPDKKTLIRLMDAFFVRSEFPTYTGKFGVALVHPKDRFYVKKLGAEMALKKAVDLKYSLVNIERFKDGTVFKFIVELKDFVEVNFFIRPTNNVVYIQFVNVVKIPRR